MSAAGVGYVGAFAGGLVSFLSPCVLPLVLKAGQIPCVLNGGNDDFFDGQALASGTHQRAGHGTPGSAHMGGK
jgi:hypothetical protein